MDDFTDEQAKQWCKELKVCTLCAIIDERTVALAADDVQMRGSGYYLCALHDAEFSEFKPVFKQLRK